MESERRDAFFLQKVSVFICCGEMCASQTWRGGGKDVFVADRFICAVGRIELPFKNPYIKKGVGDRYVRQDIFSLPEQK